MIVGDGLQDIGTRPYRVYHRPENAMLVVHPKVRTKTYGERRFDKAASTLWNSPPSSIRHEQSIGTFKKQLKTLFFRPAYSDFT